eukprot:Sspe_Gene.7689::Locus_2603_Transcript_1_1_Confidence_1.000_Length_2682::g.7689::m.7689/K08776/NPEPPS; puromycin-sensitive aminopeptidase
MPFVLPSHVSPRVYRLTLEPDLVNFTFTGSVEIDLAIHEPTNTVSLNARNLAILSAKLTQGGETADAKTINLNVKDSVLEIGAQKELQKGEGKLLLTFVGVLNDRMQGFYRSKYKHGKETKYLAATQFEPIDARECFPCWDEPAVKAVFEVTMVIPEKLSVFSNMPEKGFVLEGGKRRVTFLPSPLMSTYLLAFIVGEFDFIQGCTNNGTLIRAIAVPGKSHQLQYALDTGIKALEYYNEFFGIPYPLPKLDMVAVPDFASGAMENWGLVTYREVEMLCDETVSVDVKQRICIVVTHELSHQWFGNLVTMHWWDNLWLNEGFANFMETLCADHIHPEWAMWEHFVDLEQGAALRLDGLRSSHPVQVDIPRAEAVEEVFDNISYSKGACLVRMIYHTIGAEAFRKGIQLYMMRHKYGNTTTEDLWKALEEGTGMDLKEMMKTWVEQMGYPVLTVSLSGKALDISQEWFLADGSKGDGREWIVPLFINVGGEKLPVVQMKGKTCTVEIPSQKWVKVNAQQAAPLRVKYSTELMERLVEAAHSLSVEDRIGLLNDTYALAQSGQGSPEQVFQLLKGFSKERNDKVWSRIDGIVTNIHRILVGMPEARAGLSRFVSRLVESVVSELGWESRPEDDDNTKSLRGTVISLYIKHDPRAKDEAWSRYQAMLRDVHTPRAPPDVQQAILTNAVVTKGKAVWEELKEMHNATEDTVLRRYIYSAAGSAHEEEMQKAFLEWILSDDVRPQDLHSGLYAMACNTTDGTTGAADRLFCFIRSRLQEILQRVSTSSRPCIIDATGLGFLTHDKAKEVEDYWKAAKLEHVDMSIAQAAEGIRTRAAFASRVAASKLVTAEFWDS